MFIGITLLTTTYQVRDGQVDKKNVRDSQFVPDFSNQQPVSD